MSQLNKIESNIEDYYVLQHRQWAIGNFIMCTPTIKALSEHYGKPINVRFETPVVSQMFEKCDFMNIIQNTENRKVIFESSLHDQSIPDYEFIYNSVFDKSELTKSVIPHTYVDAYHTPTDVIGSDYFLIIRGANHMQSPAWKNLKDVGHDIYRKIINDLLQYEKPIVHIGNQQDYEEYIKPIATKDSFVVIGDIKKSLACINGASTIISNDTGMYHAAGALDKNMFVMWKDTNMVKNMSPGNHITFSEKGNWYVDFIEWKKNREI